MAALFCTHTRGAAEEPQNIKRRLWSETFTAAVEARRRRGNQEQTTTTSTAAPATASDGAAVVAASKHTFDIFFFILAALEHLVHIFYFIAGLFGNLVVIWSNRWKCLDVFFVFFSPLPLRQCANRWNCLSSNTAIGADRAGNKQGEDNK